MLLSAVSASLALFSPSKVSGADSFDIVFWQESFAEEELALTAEAIAAAAYSQTHNGSCDPGVVPCIDSDPSPSGATSPCCSGVLSAFPNTPEAQNALAAVAAEAFAGNYLCQPQAESESATTQFVVAVAAAFAQALTFVDDGCAAPRVGKACFMTESSITVSADVFATIVSSMWAETLTSGCGCLAEAEALEETTRTILAPVALEVLQSVCVDNGEVYTETAFIDELVQNHITVFADAFATVKATFSNDGQTQCAVFGEVDSSSVDPSMEEPVEAPLAVDDEPPSAAAAASDVEIPET